MAAALAVAVVATFVGVSEMRRITSKWTEESIRQTLVSVAARFDDMRRLQSAHAGLLASDPQLKAAVLRGRETPTFDSAHVTAFLVARRPVLKHDNVMLLDQRGVVLASTGDLNLPRGTTALSPQFVRWTSLGMNFTSIVRIGRQETVTSFAHVSADSLDNTTEYTIAVSDVVSDRMLETTFRGLGPAFAFMDDKGALVAQYVDRGALDRRVADELSRNLGEQQGHAAAPLDAEGSMLERLSVGGQQFRTLGATIRFPDGSDPADTAGKMIAVVSTDVEEQAGATTMRLIAFWSALGVVALSLFGLMVARRVSDPLLRLSEGARRVSEGDFSQKVEVGGSNEVADLALSFNAMTDSLRHRTESITKKVLELATLYEMSRALGSTLELEVLLDSVLDSALRIFNVEAGYVVMRDRDTEELALVAWRGKHGLKPHAHALRNSMCEWVAREGRPLIYNPPTSSDSAPGQIDDVSGATAALCVPLTSSDGVIGAVTVGSRDPEFRFTADDVRLLSTIANHATIAVGNIELFSSLQEAYIATVRALAAAVDAKDPYTRGHSDRVAEYAAAIGEQLDLSLEQATALEMAAYLHDIGKIGIREEILLKPGRLEDEEMAQMRHHPLIGANILRPVAFPWAIAPVVRHHHEHWDGKGYPAGLRGEEIPLLARILSVADSYEAMTSDRPYRRGRSAAEGIAELKRCAGTQFDPRIVDAFVAVLKNEERDREAVGAKEPGDIDPQEARAIFVALCDGMVANFRRLGGPRLSSNLEAELNRRFAQEAVPCSFSGGRLAADWPSPNGEGPDQLELMRHVVAAIAGSMARTSGTSLVDGFYNDALGGLSARMQVLAETMELYRKA